VRQGAIRNIGGALWQVKSSGVNNKHKQSHVFWRLYMFLTKIMPKIRKDKKKPGGVPVKQGDDNSVIKCFFLLGSQ